MINKFKFFSVVIASLLMSVFFLGCDLFDKDDDEEITNQAKSISISDFDVIPDMLSSSEIIEEINYEYSFYDNEPDSCYYSDTDSDDDSSDSCIGDIFDSATFKKSDDGFYELNLSGIDLKNCMLSESNDYITSFSAVMDLYVKLKVLLEDGSSVDLEGKTLNNEDILNDVKVSQIQLLQKMRMSYDISMEYNGESATSSSQYKSLMSDATNPDQACKSSRYQTSNCSYRDVSLTTTNIGSETSEYVDLLILTEKDLTSSDSGIYYTDGIIDFTINNWNGAMTYGAGSDIAPTYSATNTSGSAISGTYEGCSYIGKKAFRKRSLTVKQNVIQNITTQLKSLKTNANKLN